MAVSDALVVGEDWISEHYFTTDAAKGSFLARVLERRKEWEDLEKPADGAAPVQTPRTRLRSARPRLEELLAALPAPDGAGASDSNVADGTLALTAATLEASAELDALLREVLGFASAEYRLTDCGPVTLVRTVGDEGPAPLALLRARPAAAVEDLLVKDGRTLAGPWEPVDLAEPAAAPIEGAEPVESVSRALSTLMTDEHGPTFALVLAGRWALIAEKERWPEGRWLAVDVQIVVERHDVRRGGEVERALACLEAASLVPGPEGETWWTATLAESAAHTVGVSKDLREGVRSSIEVIANEVVRRRAAAGLAPLPQSQAQPLALQSLRFIYRIIFLLYAEASPELGVLPVGAAEYDAGYGLERLRELCLRELHEESSQSGTHIYESLSLLFALVDQGHNARAAGERADEPVDGLVFQPMRADLFRPEATALIDEVGLGNAALLRVLRSLLLTTEGGKAGRGFISYVELGINQLGAVYEGLMSYTGSFAAERLWEVAPGGDASKGSWVVARDVMEGLEERDFVTVTDEATGERRNVTYEAGEFVFRLSGRDRQRSASFYTPEVLTRFTVQQALAELLDCDGRTTTAEEVLGLTVCEPALGSGAFAIEAVRQLAEQYLSRRERELGERVDPQERPRELAKVRAYLALHQVYGVDLNATAVELAEVSLWLDTMVEGLAAPWFGLRLRRGNSLVGAKRALYSVSQLKKGAWLRNAPVAEPLSAVAEALDDDGARRLGGAVDVSDRVHHFLLPAKGWGSAVEVPTQVRGLVDAERLRALKTWRREVTKAPTKVQVRRLTALARRVEVLWELSLRRLRVAEAEASRRIDLWGRQVAPDAGSTVSREEIEAYLADEDSAYRRLRLVMDAWCALWYWPLTTDVTPPTLEHWLNALEGILGTAPKDAKGTNRTLAEASTWAELQDVEAVELGFAGARPVAAVVADPENRWLEVVRAAAAEQGFFHWELDFATVFARGGFDLQVGNPPWVRPNVEVETLLADGDPWWVLTSKPSLAERKVRLPLTLDRRGIRNIVVDGASETQVLGEFISDATVYPVMEGRPDLYRAFMCQVWEHQSERGISSLIHMETHFTDAKTPALRAATYRHLRRHWQFINELQLFDIDHHNAYGIHVYGSERTPSFVHATSLYHPDTVLRSLVHDGSGEEPGFKDPHTGTWDLRPHASRIQRVDGSVLRTWQAVTEAEDWRSTPMVSTVNSAAARTLSTLASYPRISSLGLRFSSGWNETTDFNSGRFTKAWGKASWEDAILQGPHLHVSTPLYKSPNATMKHNQDWTATDFEALPTRALPVTQYKPAGDRATYDRLYTHWGESSARDHYRIAWRRMAANTGERTLIPAIIPPGAAHVDGVFSAAMPHTASSAAPTMAALASSLLADFQVRSRARNDIRGNDFNLLPALPLDNPLAHRVAFRALRLNCMTEAYADLWVECWDESFLDDAPILERYDERPVGPVWTPDVPLRRAEDRRNAQAEIDVMVAMMLGVPVEDLCTIYRTQFAVLYDYDHGRGQGAYIYDANGRQVPTPVRQAWAKRGRPDSNDAMPLSERTHPHPGSGVNYVYSLPFRTRDRESDFHHIHSHLSRKGHTSCQKAQLQALRIFSLQR
ncbi:class I SAM-dependent DNA methyltransferase [Actinomyces gaoshouyii]|uniref:site-specific DNA-methyltransferase (adenine-specific) n=1 Tax=Actinomyces gaoshouyii TaxID=1960083 RepID=A0A8H9LJC9_9ACTO|nr:class I SAM-dependent DNA methyltransferase [Actinomyces gaoshouyii]GGO98484.1 restriction endonuclease subunit M [Actinomyces gaoshouyii]